MRMSDEIDRRLAAELIANLLKKEYQTNPVVASYLHMARHGEISAVDSLLYMVRDLVEQNKNLVNALVKAESMCVRPLVVADKKTTNDDANRPRVIIPKDGDGTRVKMSLEAYRRIMRGEVGVTEEES